jgi:hypothetical protein
MANYQACLQLEEFLISRLSKNNHNVKFKTLVMIKVNSPKMPTDSVSQNIHPLLARCCYEHVCRTGRPEFKRDMAKSVDAIKECLRKFVSFLIQLMFKLSQMVTVV